MIKPLIILFNTVSVFLFSFFFGDTPVTITANFPKNVKPNTEFVAEVKVNKSNISGFAKLQLEVPQGLIVKESDSKGGNFTFASNIAKIIWTSIPSDAEFTVKFIVMSEAGVTGSKTIGGKFSYVNNNNKEVVDMTPAEIMFEDAAAIVAATTQTTEPVKTEPTPNSNPFNNPTEPSSDVTCVRSISQGATANETNIDIKIKKGDIKGFAKYQEVIPAGYTVKGGKTNGSSFSFSDGKAKFVWVALPSQEILEISYVLEKGSSASADAKLESGEFSYLESDKTKKVKMPVEGLTPSTTPALVETQPTTTPVETNTVAATTTDNNQTTTPVNTATETTQLTATVAATTTEPVKTEMSTEPKTDAASSTATVAKKAGSVAYHVQVGAFKNAIQSDVLSKKFNITEKISSEMAEGFNKFMIGNFEEYKQARDHREGVKGKGCKSAFVVAYNGGKRITIQEALMITSQKWFK
jgi:cell division protein FtsN